MASAPCLSLATLQSLTASEVRTLESLGERRRYCARSDRGLRAGVARQPWPAECGGTDAGLHHVGGKMGTSEGLSVLVDL